MTHSPGPQSQQKLKRLVRGESPRPTPIPKLCPEVGRPVVYKLLLFRQPLGFCSLHFPEFVFGSGWRGEPGGLAFRLLDLCGQQGWVCWALVVFCGGTDPAGAREAQGLEELGFGPASSTHQKSQGMECQSHGKQGVGTEAKKRACSSLGMACWREPYLAWLSRPTTFPRLRWLFYTLLGPHPASQMTLFTQSGPGTSPQQQAFQD